LARGTLQTIQACKPPPPPNERVEENEIMSQTNPEEKVEVATTKDHQLHLLIDTPNAKV
jgi:hypothetical protein